MWQLHKCKLMNTKVKRHISVYHRQQRVLYHDRMMGSLNAKHRSHVAQLAAAAAACGEGGGSGSEGEEEEELPPLPDLE
jgi:hypothetical protein